MTNSQPYDIINVSIEREVLKMVEIAVIILCILYLVGLHVGKGLAITTLVYVGLKILQEILRKIKEKEDNE